MIRIVVDLLLMILRKGSVCMYNNKLKNAAGQFSSAD
jgi:hypothetical protein